MRPDFCFNPRFIEKDEIERNLPKIVGIFQQYEVSFAYIFGSILYAEGSNDLDIGVFFKEKKRSSLELYTDLYFDLCSVFKADNIDVAILNDTGPAFKFEVMSKGDLVYFLHHREVVEFIERTLFDHDDTRRFRRESHEELTASVREGLMKERKVNVQRVDTFLKNLKEALRDIQRLISPIENIKDFLSEEKRDTRNLCIHHLRIALESISGISRHIIAVKGFGIADLETENIIDILGRNGVIPFEFSQKIRGMAGMRNAIVHVYWNLDYEKIFEMIKKRLIDFEDFARYILKCVEREK
jgi:uncharacterized protein YutE (UPF0331/DUF86 family)/predicted nucleotidyltransferase